MDFYSAFESLNTTEKVAKSIVSSLRNRRGQERAVLRELKENIELLFMFRRKQVPAEKVIRKLSFNNYLMAADSGFNFKSIERGRVKAETTRGVPQLQKYVGWSTERLLENIYLKGKFLQNYLEMKTESPVIYINRRLEYLTRVMILLLAHINKD